MADRIERYQLNLAGEYRVASELLKRGLFATVTLGNMKGADVIAVGKSRRAAVIEVKSSNSTKFVTSFYQKYETPEAEHPTFWVLYSVCKIEGVFEDRFFILTHEEVAKRQALRNTGNGETPHIECAKRFPKGKGVDNLLINHIADAENRWQQIVDWCL